MKKTLKQLTEEVKQLKEKAVLMSAHVVWNLDQLQQVIAENDTHNEIIKVEIIHGFEPRKKCYHVEIWKYATYEFLGADLP